MSRYEQIKKLEIEIQQIRLQIIQTIVCINKLLAGNPKAIKTEAYLDLKQQYQNQKEEIHCLSALRRDLAA